MRILCILCAPRTTLTAFVVLIAVIVELTIPDRADWVPNSELFVCYR
jgi:hypothetical protein